MKNQHEQKSNHACETCEVEFIQEGDLKSHVAEIHARKVENEGEGGVRNHDK